MAARDQNTNNHGTSDRNLPTRSRSADPRRLWGGALCIFFLAEISGIFRRRSQRIEVEIAGWIAWRRVMISRAPSGNGRKLNGDRNRGTHSRNVMRGPADGRSRQLFRRRTTATGRATATVAEDQAHQAAFASGTSAERAVPAHSIIARPGAIEDAGDEVRSACASASRARISSPVPAQLAADNRPPRSWQMKN